MRLKSLITLLSVLSGLWGVVPLMAKSTPVVGIAAVIQDKIITTTMLDAAMADQLAQMHTQPSKDAQHAMRQQILDVLINQQLLLTMAEKQHIEVQHTEVAHALMVLARRHHQSLQDFKKTVQQHGGSLAALRQKIKSQIMVARIQVQLLDPQDQPTRERVRAWLDQHQYDDVAVALIDWHIPTEAMPKQAARATALSWQKTLMATGTSSPKAMPGLVKHVIPVTPVGKLPDAFAAAFKKHPKHTVLGPIQTGNGYHVLAVQTIKGQPVSAGMAWHFLGQQAVSKHLPDVLKTLRQQAYCQKFDV